MTASAILGDAAGWVAPIATAVAAIMTAANLGARVTGWGFVVFTIGSIGWSVVGLTSGQANLVATNAFLTIVNALGIWRWLGRQARYEDGSQIAAAASKAAPSTPDLIAGTILTGAQVRFADGERAGAVIEIMLECETARLAYLVVGSGGVGGVGERLRAIRPDQLELCTDDVALRLDRASFEALPDWQPEARP